MSGDERLSPEEELHYFIEDRKDNIENNIKPALAEHAVILQDRYFYSTVAYQGARGFDVETLQQQHDAFIITPDLTCLFDLAPAEGLRRIQNSGNRTPDHFETIAYLERVKAIYDTFQAPHITHVNAGRTPESIHNEIKTLIFSLLKIDAVL
jgi:dTMP kinase